MTVSIIGFIIFLLLFGCRYIVHSESNYFNILKNLHGSLSISILTTVLDDAYYGLCCFCNVPLILMLLRLANYSFAFLQSMTIRLISFPHLAFSFSYKIQCKEI